MTNQNLLRAGEAMAVLLFFLQAVRVLFSVLFGIIYDSVFAGPVSLFMVVCVLLTLLASLAPLLAPRRERGVRLTLLVTSVIVFLSRIPLTFNNPDLRLYSSMLIVAAGSLYAATLLREGTAIFPVALIAALAGDQLFRALGNTYDIALRQGWLPAQVVISMGLVGLAGTAYSRSRPALEEATGGKLGLLGGLGIGALLFLETSLLAFPNALARWSGASYSVMTPTLLLVTLLPLLPGVQGLAHRLLAKQIWRLLLSLFTCLCLAAGYFWQSALAAIALLLTQLLVLLAQLLVADGQTRHYPTGSGSLAGARKLAFGLVFFLLINFAYAFAFTYAYTLDFFRGAGLPIVLVAGLLATLPAAGRGVPLEEKPLPQRWLAVGIVAVSVLVSAVFARPPALRLKEAGSSIRMGTYNIHYGYNTAWQLQLEEMARTIEESEADIVALQEADACRITSYGIDDTLWLGRRLGMQAIYQPTIEHLTGIALLSRLPVRQVEGQLLTSRLEQTAIVRAQVKFDDDTLDAYGIWLGLEPEERAVQLSEALDFIGDGPAILGGDFNATPGSPVYHQLVEAGFTDGAADFAPSPTSPSEAPEERIDYVWVRGLTPVDGEVLDSTASDHRMVVVEAALECAQR